MRRFMSVGPPKKWTEGGHWPSTWRGTAVAADCWGRLDHAGPGRAGCVPCSGRVFRPLDELRSASYILTAVSKFRFNACQLGALGIELGLEGKGLAQSRLVIG